MPKRMSAGSIGLKHRFQGAADALVAAISVLERVFDAREAKYNYHHDDRDRFTFSSGQGFGGGGASGSWQSIAQPKDSSAQSRLRPHYPVENVALADNSNSRDRHPGIHPWGHIRHGVQTDVRQLDFRVKDNSVVVSHDIEDRVSAMARTFRATKGVKLTVTSGTRSSQEQAEAMYNRRHDGSDGSDYANHKAFNEIDAVYQSGIKSGSNPKQIIADMRRVIDGQVAKGVYISKHLTGHAVDIKIRDLTARQLHKLKVAAQAHAGRTHLEGNRLHPHLHVQF